MIRSPFPFYKPRGKTERFGQPIDGKRPLCVSQSRRIDGRGVSPLERENIRQPISTGIRAIDGLLTCGLGQRMGIFSGPGVGKSMLMSSIARYTSATEEPFTLRWFDDKLFAFGLFTNGFDDPRGLLELTSGGFDKDAAMTKLAAKYKPGTARDIGLATCDRSNGGPSNVTVVVAAHCSLPVPLVNRGCIQTIRPGGKSGGTNSPLAVCLAVPITASPFACPARVTAGKWPPGSHA